MRAFSNCIIVLLLVLCIPPLAGGQLPVGEVPLHGAQWIKDGLYDGVVGGNRLLFFIDSDCGRPSPPESLQNTKHGVVVLVWSSGTTGNLCFVKLVERVAYETDPASLTLWMVNDKNISVDIDDQDRVIGRSIRTGSEFLNVESPVRTGPSSFEWGAHVAGPPVLDMSGLLLRDVAVSAQGANFAETPLATHSNDRGFVSSIPTSLQHEGFAVFVRVNRNGKVFLFKSFVPSLGR